MKIEDIRSLKENLELLIDGRDPKTGYKVDDTIINSSSNKQILKDTVSLLNCFLRLDFNPTKIDKRKKYAFCLSDKEKREIQISETPITISAFVYQLNAPIKTTMRKITTKEITDWLVCQGFLKLSTDEYGKRIKVMTEKSSTIGLLYEERKSEAGHSYTVITYNENAQRFIIDHLDEITDQEIRFPS